MNKDTLEGNWKEVKGKIKAKWAKLNDNDIDEVNGKLERLSGVPQKKYGYAKDKAEAECSSFKASMTSALSKKKR